MLVSVTHRAGTAGVVADSRGEVWLCADLENGGGILISDHWPVVEPDERGRAVAGGRLPASAASAVVTDVLGAPHAARTGGGAWMAALEDEFSAEVPCAVRFADSRGHTICPAVVASSPGEPVEDATEDCPACGARAWVGGKAPIPAVRCRRCGHQAVGVLTAVSQRLVNCSSRDSERAREARRAAAARVLRTVDFPVYAVRGREATVTHSRSGSRGTTAVTVSHPGGDSLTVESARADPSRSPAVRARRALARTVAPPDQPEMSEAAATIWLAARDRECWRAAAGARIAPRWLRIDGARVRFTTAFSDGRWAAVADLGAGLSVTVAGQGTSPPALDLTALGQASLGGHAVGDAMEQERI